MLTLTDYSKRANERTDYVVKETITTGSAYTANQVLGGLITIADTSAGQRNPNLDQGYLSSIIQSLAVLDPDSMNSAIDLFFFSALPTATYTDRTTFAPSAADVANCVGFVQVAAGDYVSMGAAGSMAAGKNQSNLGRVMKPSGPQNSKLYCIPVIRDTGTYTTGTMTFRFQFSHGL